MTPPQRPRVDCEQHHASLAVSDVLAAAQFYAEKLGFFTAFTWGEPPTMAGVNLGSVQIFLEHGTPSPKGLAVYFVVGDADELFAFQRANGVVIVQEPGDRPWGLRDYTVRDLDGYFLTFGHRLRSPAGEPLEIERVAVPLRLEKRLAALMHDLAAHKRMTLTSCFEEILLHTCDQLGDGVPSPHTRADLRKIQELKKKHGIDYDSHASYRFVEKTEDGEKAGTEVEGTEAEGTEIEGTEIEGTEIKGTEGRSERDTNGEAE
jgi:catechol 2,3-dioxygenase-like lactoylglutathione lyase family enzyme